MLISVWSRKLMACKLSHHTKEEKLMEEMFTINEYTRRNSDQLVSWIETNPNWSTPSRVNAAEKMLLINHGGTQWCSRPCRHEATHRHPCG